MRRTNVLLLGLGAAAGLAVAGLALFTARVAQRVERALPPRGHFLDVDGGRVHYIDEGEGPPVVFVHGLGGHARTFTHSMVARLADRFRVIVMERPGSGYSTRPRGASAALGAQADTVGGVIEALGLERPLLVGHSLGGAVALALTVRRPDLVGGLALISPLTHVQEEVPALFRRMALPSALIRRLVAWTVATPLVLLRREAVVEALFGPDPVPEDYATKGGGPLGLRPAAFFGASTDLVAVNEDLPALVARYGSLRVPVGVLYGTGDRVLDPSVHGVAVAEAVPGLRLELIEGGHMLPLTASERAAALVVDVALRMGVLSDSRCADAPS